MQVAHVALKLDAAARVTLAEQLRAVGLDVCFLQDKADLDARLHEIELLLLGRPPRLDWSRATQLKLIHVAGAGVDPLFPADGLRAEVVVSNCRGAHADAVRDHVLALLLAFARDLPRAWVQQRAKEWSGYPSKSLTGQTVCVVGLGEIGRRVAAALGALGMRVVGVNRTGKACAAARVVYPVEHLPMAVSEADYVVLCLPLTSSTRRLFDARVLDLLTQQCVLINVARGGIVDEHELESRLRAGRLRGAALDVLEREPLPKDSSLWSCPGLLLTPHCAGYTPEYFASVGAAFIDALRHVQRGEAPLTSVSRQFEY